MLLKGDRPEAVIADKRYGMTQTHSWTSAKNHLAFVQVASIMTLLL